MYVSRGERLAAWAPATGIVYVVLFVATIIALGAGPGDTDEEIRSYYTEHGDRDLLFFFLLVPAALFLLWFLGSLRAALVRAEGEPARLSSLAYAGGVVNVALLIAAASALASVAAVAEEDQFVLDPNTVRVVGSLGYLLFVGSGMAATVLMAATGILTLRTGVLPRWLGWVSLVTAVMMLASITFIPVFVLLAWVLILSVLMLMRTTPWVSRPAAGSAGGVQGGISS
jgi:hypothetical protein